MDIPRNTFKGSAKFRSISIRPRLILPWPGRSKGGYDGNMAYACRFELTFCGDFSHNTRRCWCFFFNYVAWFPKCIQMTWSMRPHLCTAPNSVTSWASLVLGNQIESATRNLPHYSHAYKDDASARNINNSRRVCTYNTTRQPWERDIMPRPESEEASYTLSHLLKKTCEIFQKELLFVLRF